MGIYLFLVNAFDVGRQPIRNYRTDCSGSAKNHVRPIIHAGDSDVRASVPHAPSPFLLALFRFSNTVRGGWTIPVIHFPTSEKIRNKHCWEENRRETNVLFPGDTFSTIIYTHQNTQGIAKKQEKK